MVATIAFTLADVKMLAGVKGIDLMIDGVRQRTLQFGDSVAVEVEPGSRAVQVILHGVVQRKSRVLVVNAPEGGQIAIVGTYTRLWGTIKLKTA